MHVRHREDRVGLLAQLPIPFGHKRNDRRAPGLHFHEVIHRLLVQAVARRQHHHRHVLVDQRDRAVLHLAGRVTLGVDVRNLFELQRPFQRDRVVDPPPQVQKIVLVVVPPGDRDQLCLASQDMLDVRRQHDEPVEPCLAVLGRHLAPHTPQMQSQQVERRELRRERLRGRHADFRAGMRIEHALGLAGQAAPHDIADGHHLGALLPGMADGRQRVGRLTGLRNRDEQVALPDQRVAIAELRPNVHLDRRPHHLLNKIFPDQAGVP